MLAHRVTRISTAVTRLNTVGTCITTGPMAPLAEKLTDPLKNVITNSFNVIPSLNWNLGGIRIPITAESTVRMQTPFAASGG